MVPASSGCGPETCEKQRESTVVDGGTGRLVKDGCRLHDACMLHAAGSRQRAGDAQMHEEGILPTASDRRTANRHVLALDTFSAQMRAVVALKPHVSSLD